MTIRKQCDDVENSDKFTENYRLKMQLFLSFTELYMLLAQQFKKQQRDRFRDELVNMVECLAAKTSDQKELLMRNRWPCDYPAPYPMWVPCLWSM